MMSAPTAINNPLNRYNYHQDYQSLTPGTSNSNTPSTISPTSPRNASTSTSPGRYPHSSRQIKPPKTPLYVPAVLRPTENPSRHRPSKSSSSNCVSRILASASASPITPPSSADSSWDAREGQKTMEDTIQQRLMASEGITRIVTDEWNDDNFESVTGVPTRDHWKVRCVSLRDPPYASAQAPRPLRCPRDLMRLVSMRPAKVLAIPHACAAVCNYAFSTRLSLPYNSPYFTFKLTGSTARLLITNLRLAHLRNKLHASPPPAPLPPLRQHLLRHALRQRSPARPACPLPSRRLVRPRMR